MSEAKQFDVLEIEGLTIGSENNRVSIAKTFLQNMRRLPDANRKLKKLREVFHEFKPHAVITDFEPMTAYLAHHYSLPLISLDNQQRMRYIDAPVPAGLESQARTTRAVIRSMVPLPDVVLITTFVQGPTRNERTFQYAPLVDEAVRNLVVNQGNHILVYLTSGFDSLLKQLKLLTRERFRVYGCGARVANGPLEFMEPSRSGFLQDLAGCKAVIATAGFTLISESLYLGKPYLAYPMQGQYEQQLNGHQLAEAGYGKHGLRADREEIAAFLYDLPDYRAQLNDYPRHDNSALLSKIDELLADDAQVANRYRQLRKGSATV